MASSTPRLKNIYQDQIKPALMEEFGYKNDLMVPKLDKIVLNMGVGEAAKDSKKAKSAEAELTAIAGQKAVPTRARQSLSGFRLREGMVIGAKTSPTAATPPSSTPS